MEDKNLFVFVNGAGQKIKTSGLTVNQNSTNNVLNFISVGKYSSVTCSFKYANGKVSAEYHMIPQGKYELQADDNEAVLTENADNLYLYLFTIPYEVTSSYISGNSARMNVSFAGYAYDEKQYLKQVMSANTQIVINQAVQSDTLDQSYSAADVENMWRAIGDVTVTAADVEQNAEDIDDLQETVANHETRIYDLEHTAIVNYSPGTGIVFTGAHNNVINADTSILALKSEVNAKQDELPLPQSSGLVLRSTSTPNVFEWTEGGRVYTAGSGINISQTNELSVDTTTIATVSALNSVGGRVTTIEGLIPSQATSSNQLADKDFVNSSISSATATFRGNFATKADLDAYAGAKKNGDYAVVQADETHNNETWRYKYNGVAWVAEYMINETAFTAAQLAAINSGITTTLVNQIGTNQSNIAAITDGASINTFSGVESALSQKATDSAVVHKAGEETISGKKTFSTQVQLVNSDNYVKVDSNNATVLGADGSDILAVNSGTSIISSNFRPISTGTLDLGSSSYLWNNLFANKLQFATSGLYIEEDSNNDLGLYKGSDEKLKVTSDGATLKGNLIPLTNNLYNLGNSSYKWKDVYIAGKLSDGTAEIAVNKIANIDGAQTISGLKTFSNGLYVGGWKLLEDSSNYFVFNDGTNDVLKLISTALEPVTTASVDLGGASNKFKDLYLSGALKDGTNSISIANIATLNTAQVLTGKKTIEDELDIRHSANGDVLKIQADTDSRAVISMDNTELLRLIGANGTVVSVGLYPVANNSIDLGKSGNAWKNLYLAGDAYINGKLRDGNNANYGLALPASTSWTADKTIATTDQLPTVNNGTLTIQANGTDKGSFTANQAGNTTINITAADLGLSAAIKFIGTTSTQISDGSTTNVVVIGGNSVTAQNGDVVIYNDIEYIWNGSLATPAWEQLGDESSYALKTVTVTGTGVLAGGGSLEANRTITHNEVLGSAVTTSDVYKLKIDKYGHISEAVSAGLATVATSGSYNDLSNTPSIPTKVSDLQNDTGFTTNTGTVTSVTAGAGLNTTSNDTGTDGGTITTSGTIHLTKTAVTPGTYQGITVDKYGRVTGATDQGYSTTTGTVTSVRVQAGTGLTSSQSTAQSTSLDTTISIASGYKLPTTSEWSSKQDASTAYNTSNIVYSVTEPASPTAGMIWLEPVE